MRRLGVSLVIGFAITASSFAQLRGGILTVSLTNGTTGGEGRAEKVTLYRLRNEMIPAKELGSVTGRFEMRDIEVEGERPMLLQVVSQGVTYNETVQFGRGYEAEVEVEVYDVFSEWNDRDLEVTTARALYRRDGAKLLVDEVYVVENRSSPPKTYHDSAGTFRFHLPTKNLLQLHSVSARGASGMPVPQQASPDARAGEASTYVTKTAFKPGETEIVISYEVGYGEEEYETASRAFYPIEEMYAFVAPPDVRITPEGADGWENLGPEPEGRFVAVRKRGVTPGTPIVLKLSGGGERAAALVSESSSGAESRAQSGTVSVIPDGSRFSKAVIVVLMAAALGYGLLSTLYPSKPRRG